MTYITRREPRTDTLGSGVYRVMAGKSTGLRQPMEQLKELEKDGRIRRFLCHVLILRVFAYIVAQPASFFFILSLMVITVSMPLVALHVRNTGSLPDLDAMRVRRENVGGRARRRFDSIAKLGDYS